MKTFSLKQMEGVHVSAIGSCGSCKNKEVFGVLKVENDSPIVCILDEDGNVEEECTVYAQTIEPA